MPNQSSYWVNPGLACLQVHGPDAHAFLQGQLTCQMDDLSAPVARLAAHCNPKGRILSLFFIMAWEGAYLLLMPTPMIDPCVTEFKRFVFRSKVCFDQRSDLQLAACMNPNHRPQAPWSYDQQGGRTTIHLPGQPTALLAIGSTKHMAPLDATDDSSAWHAWRWQNRIPMVLAESAGLFTPHMLNLVTHGGVSFDKGCYCGQEIIARTQHLGQNKKTLQAYVGPLHHDANPGDSLSNASGDPVGKVLEAMPINGAQHLLAVVHERALEQALYLNHETNHAYQHANQTP